MSYANAVKAAGIVRDAGGRIVGRTRLQKVAYLLSVTGLEDGLPFSYKHYGPYSEDLATAARDADLLGLLTESEQQASWGGMYSTYVVHDSPSSSVPSARRQLATEAAAADAIELELVATAVFLAKEGHSDPWIETVRRKPEKAENDRIDKARLLYRRLSAIETPVPWPAIM
ncbi:MAG: hypothetical protein ABSE69_18985 [Roseiarcus sp.]|jgi:uncharacterized protein